jgi:subtilisin-like proprotein convertase family protein
VVVEDTARVLVPDDPDDPNASLSYNAHGANGEPNTVSASWTYAGAPMVLEHVTFSLEIELIYMEGLTLSVTSPEGTTATLMEPLLNDYSPLFTFFGIPIPTLWSWSFGLEAFRGEDPNGEWIITLSEVNSTFDTDNYPAYGELEGGKVNWFEFDLHGRDAGEDDVYHYTDEAYRALADQPERMSLADGSGNDWFNLAAVTGDLLVDLASDGTGGASVAGAGKFAAIQAGTFIENAVAGDGNDILIGNEFGNRLVGMRGDDVLSGGSGQDILSGGQGDDWFEFVLGSGLDTITDFTAGAGTEDAFVLPMGTLYSLSNVGNDGWIDFGDGDGFIVAGVDYQQLHADDFLYV